MLNPFRSKPGLIVHSREPFNAEPPLKAMRATFLTAQADFYVRSHGPIPRLDEEAHRLTIGGLVGTPLTLTLAELKRRFSPVTLTATMQCAGNRRADLQSVRPTTGDLWAPGAIGNAAWTGVRLADVLAAAGAETGAGLHVAFEAADEVEADGEGRFRYGASIPMVKALSPEVLLAFAMNGEALAPEHGFPLRAVVPGYAGVRSPKWLTAVTVQDRPSDNHMQQRDYKLLPPDVTSETVDWDKGVTINAIPVNAAICEPEPRAALRAGRTSVRGYAIATGRAIARVDVSVDGGRSWAQATIEHEDAQPWSWTFWHAMLDLPAGAHEWALRAWDAAGQTQPALPADTWNFKGYLSAAWHRMPVHVA